MTSINLAAIPILGVPLFPAAGTRARKSQTSTVNLPAVRASGTSQAEAGQYPVVPTSFAFGNQTSPKGVGICNPCNSGTCGTAKSACCGDKNVATAAAAIFAAILLLSGGSDSGSGSA
jgi:hypothetical protein